MVIKFEFTHLLDCNTLPFLKGLKITKIRLTPSIAKENNNNKNNNLKDS